MKKILFAISLVMTMAFGANAQGRMDNYFGDWSGDSYEIRDGQAPDVNFPSHFDSNDNPAPVGSGLLVLTALGAGYAVMRKRK